MELTFVQLKDSSLFIQEGFIGEWVCAKNGKTFAVYGVFTSLVM